MSRHLIDACAGGDRVPTLTWFAARVFELLDPQANLDIRYFCWGLGLLVHLDVSASISEELMVVSAHQRMGFAV
jgi:hypothetical protein